MDNGEGAVAELNDEVMNQKVYASAVNSPSMPARGLLISGYAFETMLRPLKEQNVRYILQVSPPVWEAATRTPAHSPHKATALSLARSSQRWPLGGERIASVAWGTVQVSAHPDRRRGGRGLDIQAAGGFCVHRRGDKNRCVSCPTCQCDLLTTLTLVVAGEVRGSEWHSLEGSNEGVGQRQQPTQRLRPTPTDQRGGLPCVTSCIGLHGTRIAA